MQEFSNEWVEHWNKKPEVGQYVWYYFEHVGVHYGQYDGGDTYYGSNGFLNGDVTHWMVAPPPPPEEN